jgi:hypothetical protein
MNKVIDLISKYKYYILWTVIVLNILWVAFMCVSNLNIVAHVIGIIIGFFFPMLILGYCYPTSEGTFKKLSILIASFVSLGTIEVFSILNLILILIK